MQIKDYIQLEDQLSAAMLEEAASNSEIKKILFAAGNIFLTAVINPLRVELKTITSFSDLPDFMQSTIKELASSNTADSKQYGALVAEHFQEANEIILSIDNIKILVEKIEFTLHQVLEANTCDEIVKVIKLMSDLAICYFLYYPDYLHGKEFSQLKEMVLPTPEEFDLRLLRTEVGEVPQLAISFGLSRDPNYDLIPEEKHTKLNKGRVAGKAVYAGLSMEKRFEVLTKNFDETKKLYHEIEKILNLKKAQFADAQIEAEVNELEDKLLETRKKKHTYLKKMLYYKIPLHETARLPVAEYAKHHETTFEKLAKLADPLKQQSLPLIASVSGSTARVFITLQDQNAFNRADGRFDFDKAQIIANCLMGFLTFAGHHSITEVAEPYNRLLDYVAMYHEEKIPISAIPGQKINEKFVEFFPPYYVIGEYKSFIHHSYAERVMKKARKKD